jgi:hypothetical protein
MDVGLKKELDLDLVENFSNNNKLIKKIKEEYFFDSSTTITARLNDGKPLINKEKEILALSLKRIRVFTKIKP